MFKFGIASSFVAPTNSAGPANAVQPKSERSAFAAFIEKLKPGYQDKVALAKIEAMFQVGNEVRHIETGKSWSVFDADLGSALLIDAKDVVFMTSWLHLDGGLKAYVADEWELVKAANPKPEVTRVEWELDDSVRA